MDFENSEYSTIEKLAQDDIEILHNGNNSKRNVRHKQKRKGEKVPVANHK